MDPIKETGAKLLLEYAKVVKQACDAHRRCAQEIIRRAEERGPPERAADVRIAFGTIAQEW